MTTTDQFLFDLAASQHGLISRAQALLAGLSPDQLRHRVRRGAWLPITPHVLQAPGTPDTPQQAVMAQVLDAGPGAVVSHGSALGLWGLPGWELLPVHVSAPRRGIWRGNSLAVLHTSRRLPPHHITIAAGIPLTTPARCVFDIAASTPLSTVARTLDQLWADRLLTYDDVAEVLHELAEKGRAGTRLIRMLLEERQAEYRPAESNLERRLHSLIGADGQPALERQVDLTDDKGVWIGRVDALDRDARLVVEVDSDRYHASLTHRRQDRDRDERLRMAGYEVLRVREHDVWHRGRDTARAIGTLRRQLRRHAS